MKIYILLVISILLFSSCTNNNLVGRKLYVLRFGTLAMEEVELNFISDNIVERKTTLVADIYDCNNYKNNPTLMNTSTLFNYTYENDILKIPQKSLIIKITALQTGHYLTNTNEIFYSNSIVEHLNDSFSYQRLLFAMRTKELANRYFKMIRNNNKPTFIEKDGKYQFNSEK